MSVQEVIDLTTESPVQLAVDTPNPSANTSRDGRKLRRKKKSSNSKSSSTGTPEEVPSTLSNSNELNAKPDHPLKRKRIHETSNERRSQTHKRDSGELDKSDSTDLFFVDLSPTAIPSIPIPQVSSTTTNCETENVDKLLLPSHVTVFGNTLVEIISQPSDSDDEQFIKYLDYEDTRVCTH
jgi:protein AIR1/2